MNQYLSEIKTKVDLIVVVGTQISVEDIIFYMLNGLPPFYQSFKTSIRTKLQPLSLDDFFSLLCSEETIQIVKAAKIHHQTPISLTSYLTTSHGRNSNHGRSNTRRGRGRSSSIEC